MLELLQIFAAGTRPRRTADGYVVPAILHFYPPGSVPFGSALKGLLLPISMLSRTAPPQ
jgi:hypothetical protein